MNTFFRVGKILLPPLFLLMLATLWGIADITKKGPLDPFRWSQLLTHSGWLEPITFTPLWKQPKTYLTNSNSLEDVFCLPDDKHCWSVGGIGTILHTINGGKSWQPQISGTDEYLSSTYFITPKVGWAVGGSGTILHTSDGGKNWQQQTNDTKELLYSVYFTSPELGWAVGNRGTILHTTNGGKSWQLQISNTAKDLNSVYFSSSKLGWTVGDNGTILHTINGGVDWQPQTSGTDEKLNSVNFTAPVGWVVGDNGIILHTTDDGASWQPQTSGTDDELNSVYFSSPELGWVTGGNIFSSNVILHTTNGGKNWQPQTSNTDESLNSVYFTSPKLGWAVGGNMLFGSCVILHTTNGGKSWQPQTSTTDTYLNSAYFTFPELGRLVGDSGTILHTNDGGVNWQTQTSGTDEHLASVYFVSPELGWVVGYSGTILHTTNGGVNWQPQTSGTDKYLGSVYFVSPELGWAVGYNGTILHTTNGGVNWQPQTSGTDKSLNSVYFIDPELGWVVGDSHTILHTINGGKSWQPQTSSTDEDLNSVYFTSPELGWIAGGGNEDTFSSSVILHTTNGGKNWQPQFSSEDAPLNSVYFISSKLGWAVGYNSTILHTTNGGTNWQHQASSIQTALASVYFSSPESGWVVGGSGTVHHTTNGGQTWSPQFVADKKFHESVRDKRFGNYYHWPSPLALLAIVLCACWLFVRLHRMSQSPAEYLSDERGGVADAPVEDVDEDKLGYAPLARGIYKLIRNLDSRPPLAIAVSAPWGQGKSSVMNMLHDLLKDHNAVVQFNAWHYPDEGHILATLIEHIRAQAVPNSLSWANFRFRWNLLWRRVLAPYWRWWAVILPVSGFAMLYIGQAFNLEWNTLRTTLAQQSTDFIKPLSNLIGQDLVNASPVIGVLLVLVTLPLWAKNLLAPLKSFTPGGGTSVYSAAWNKFRTSMQTTNRDWAADTGIRFQFQQDFADICYALGNRQLVLLIDDLDRCDPQHIVQIISTFNFLSSNKTPCYVIVALDWEYVRASLGIAYNEIAAALLDKTQAIATDAQPVKNFAENYLRKIIQLKVELPEVDVVNVMSAQDKPAQDIDLGKKFNYFHVKNLISRYCRANLNTIKTLPKYFSKLFASAAGRNIESSQYKFHKKHFLLPFRWLIISLNWFLVTIPLALFWELLVRRIIKEGRSDAIRLGNIIFTAIIATLVSAALVYTLVAFTGPSPQATEPIAQPNITTAPETPKLEPKTTEQILAEGNTTEKTNQPMLVLNPQKNSAELRALWFIVALGTALIIWGIWFARQERDSAEFKNALTDWKGKLGDKVKTPREWRRLENNLRFFIMIARSYDHIDNWKKLNLFLGRMKTRLIVYAENGTCQPMTNFKLDESIATRLVMADIYFNGEIYNLLKKAVKADEYAGINRMWESQDLAAGDETLTQFFKHLMEGVDNDREQAKRWLSLHAFKLQLPKLSEQ